jgi:hypothetical protein
MLRHFLARHAGGGLRGGRSSAEQLIFRSFFGVLDALTVAPPSFKCGCTVARPGAALVVAGAVGVALGLVSGCCGRDHPVGGPGRDARWATPRAGVGRVVPLFTICEGPPKHANRRDHLPLGRNSVASAVCFNGGCRRRGAPGPAVLRRRGPHRCVAQPRVSRREPAPGLLAATPRPRALLPLRRRRRGQSTYCRRALARVLPGGEPGSGAGARPTCQLAAGSDARSPARRCHGTLPLRCLSHTGRLRAHGARWEQPSFGCSGVTRLHLRLCAQPGPAARCGGGIGVEAALAPGVQLDARPLAVASAPIGLGSTLLSHPVTRTAGEPRAARDQPGVSGG